MILENIYLIINLWDSLYNLWKYSEAIEYYKKWLTIEPQNISLLTNLWNSFFNLWKYGESRKFYNKALLLDPKFEASLRWIAQLDELEGKKKN